MLPLLGWIHEVEIRHTGGLCMQQCQSVRAPRVIAGSLAALLMLDCWVGEVRHRRPQHHNVYINVSGFYPSQFYFLYLSHTRTHTLSSSIYLYPRIYKLVSFPKLFRLSIPLPLSTSLRPYLSILFSLGLLFDSSRFIREYSTSTMSDPDCPRCAGDGIYENKVDEWVTVTCGCGNNPDCDDCGGDGTYNEWQMRIEYVDCDC